MPDTPLSTDLDADSIAVAAQQPQKASVDGVAAEAHSIPDQITADRYRRTKTAVAGKSGWGAVRIARVLPPGTTG